MNNIITIDGPSGVGKGTLAMSLATMLGWNYLNSGALYRVLAYLSEKQEVDYKDTQALVNLSKELNIQFKINKNILAIIFNKEDISNLIQTEYSAKIASKIASNKELRKSLVGIQRAFYKDPGLVAEGRDMGSVIFQQAQFKFFFTGKYKN